MGIKYSITIHIHTIINTTIIVLLQYNDFLKISVIYDLRVTLDHILLLKLFEML